MSKALQRPSWGGVRVKGGTFCILHKDKGGTAQGAVREVWSHIFGWELRLLIDGDLQRRRSVARGTSGSRQPKTGKPSYSKKAGSVQRERRAFAQPLEGVLAKIDGAEQHMNVALGVPSDFIDRECRAVVVENAGQGELGAILRQLIAFVRLNVVARLAPFVGRQ